MADPRAYVVRQGDFLSRLAHELGFDAEEAWNDPKNGDLKKKRPNPDMLVPGDVVYFSPKDREWQAVSLGTSKKFEARAPLVTITLCFKHGDKALANEPYLLEGISGEPGTTKGDGTLSLKVPMTTRSFVVYLVARGEAHEVKLGYLDPPETPTGAQMRLAALGVFGRTGGRELVMATEHLAAGVRLFQRMNGLDMTGVLDEATTQKLVEVYGS